MSLNGIKGDLYFMVRESSEYDNYEKVSVTTEGLTANSYIVKGHVGNLKLDELYFYDLMYEIVVDGLSFQYKSESSYFWTLKPIATTLDVVSVTTTSATVECSFENVPEGAICGVQYDGDKVIRTTATDGRKTFTISGLKSNTTYYYRAFIQINGKNFYGDMETLKTEATEADKFVGMWKGTQFLPNGSTNGGGSYLYLNQDGTAIFENNATKGTWSYEGASVTVNLEPVPGAWGFPLVKIIIEGTLDDVDNPTQMTGQITYYNEWGEHQTNTFVFYPV